MPIQLIDHYTREQIMADPTSLYVFGDNMTRTGYGGQANAARNCPNVVGIPTLYAPGVPFTNDTIDNALVLSRLYAAFAEIAEALERDVTVYWPSAGVGTGIADLANNSPMILSVIERMKEELFK